MSSYPEEYLKNIITNVALANKLEKYDYTLNDFDDIGQNYFGVLIPIVLTGFRDGQRVDFHLVMKLAPTDERFRVSGALTLFFAKEIFVYSTLFEAYKRLQSSNNQFVFPNCYYVDKEYCKEALVIEDMRFKGYKLHTEMYLNYNYTISSIVELSKLHALSFILKEKETQLHEEVLKICVPLNPETNKRFMNILEDRLDKALVVFKDTKYENFLNDLRRNYEEYINNMVNSVKGTAVCHGDIWKENILFCKNETSIQACLIDYQTARISSPAFDVLFLLMTSTTTQIRHNLTQITEVYYENFNLMFRDAGLKTVYSLEDFYHDLKVCAYASFVIANTAIWLSSGMQQEGHVRSKIICKTEDDVMQATTLYKNRITEVLDDFCKFGYFDLGSV